MTWERTPTSLVSSGTEKSATPASSFTRRRLLEPMMAPLAEAARRRARRTRRKRLTLYSSKHHVSVDTLDGYPQSLLAPPNTPFISSNRGPGIERHVVLADSLRERIHIVVFINIIGFRSSAGRYWHLVWLVYYSLLTLLLARVCPCSCFQCPKIASGF